MGNIFSKEILNEFILKAPELKEYLDNVTMELEPSMSPPFEYLVRAIIYQQLAYKAAKTIHDRFVNLVGQVTIRNLLAKTEDKLRGVGLSRQKASYVQNVARAFSDDGLLNHYQDKNSLDKLPSAEITKLFSQIKGVGEWTVQMYLIFSLGRLDVISQNDLGVRKGIQKIYNLDKLPTPGKVKKIAENWHPLETVGTYLTWRVLDT